jgi:membrane protease YdiL (CAAX protease family)
MGSEPEPEPGTGTETAASALGYRGRAALSATAVGLAGFLSLVAWQVLLGSVALSATGSLSAVDETLLGTLALGLGTGSTALLYLRVTDREWSFVDLEWPSRRDAGYAVGGVLVLFGATFGLEALFSAAGVRTAQHGITETAAGSPEVLLLLIPASWLLVGPGEELLFRNVVQKSLYGAFSRPTAVVVASLVFAAVHLPAYSTGTTLQAAASLALVFSLSLVLGALYVRTDNLAVPAFVHGTYNAVQFAVLYVQLTDGGLPALLAFA